MTSRRRILLGSALVLVLAYGAWYQLTGRVPAGQAPLTTLSTASLDAVVEEFNRASTDLRIVVLLSPT